MDVKTVTAKFGSTDKNLMLMMAVIHALVVAMNKSVRLVVLRCYVHLLDVKTVTEKFGRTDKHFWQMMDVTHANVYVVDKIVMLFVH